MIVLTALALAGPGADPDEGWRPCDPHGHEPARVVLPMPELVCPVSLPAAWLGGAVRERALRDHLSLVCEPKDACAADCAPLTAWADADRLQERLLADVERLGKLDPGACAATRDAALWACLGLEPLPAGFGARVFVGGDGSAVDVVGPLQPGGPPVVVSGGRVSHGCGIEAWGANARLTNAQYTTVPLSTLPDLSGFMGDATVAEALHEALIADLARVPGLIEHPPEACASRVAGLSNQQGLEQVWACLELTPLPPTMRPMIRFHTRSVTKGGVTSVKRQGMEWVQVTGSVHPSAPAMIWAVDERGVVTVGVDSAAAIDPRYR